MADDVVRVIILKISLFTLLRNMIISLRRYELKVKKKLFNERQIKNKTACKG
jgi:hypothetical protein